MGWGGGEREVQEGEDICILMVDSHPPIKNNIFFKKVFKKEKRVVSMQVVVGPAPSSTFLLIPGLP